jgi:NAD(P)-dependent dehydrogenase (short-subunit alcohol dehydrogenase family)
MTNNNFGRETTADEAASFYASEIQGKTVLVTGSTWGGLGAESARVIAKHNPKLLILAGRKQEALDETVQKIKEESPKANLRTLIIDLASLESVKKAAAEVNQYPEPIDVLINNAGIMASPYHTTKDGFEGQLGTNHLGPFVFTNLILPRVLASSSRRIVNVSSGLSALSSIHFDDPQFKNGETYAKWVAYGQSKTANILFSRELAKRYGSKGLVAFSLHPGVIATNLARDVKPEEFEVPFYDAWGQPFDSSTVDFKTLEAGSSTHIVAAFDQSIKDQSGSYLDNCQIANDSQHLRPYATNDENAHKLWTLSEQLVEQQFSL